MANTQIIVPRLRVALMASEFPTNVGAPQAVAFSYGMVDRRNNNTNTYDVSTNPADFNQFTLAAVNPQPDDPAVLFVCAITEDEAGVLQALDSRRFTPATPLGIDLSSGVILGAVEGIAANQSRLLWDSILDKTSGTTQTLRAGRSFTDHDWLVVYYAATGSVNAVSRSRSSIQIEPFLSGGFSDVTITALGLNTFQYTTGSGAVLSDSSVVEIWGV